MSKKLLRTKILNQLKTMDSSQYQRLSQKIANQVIESDEFRESSTIGLTISKFPEVDTRPIIEAAWKNGKRVCVPKCNNDTRAMDFRTISSYDNLETVYMGLLEPIITETESVGKGNIDLQIVPGVVFSPEGYRIGFGGGYYDRYLPGFKGKILALAFEFQTGHKNVPKEMHDIPLGLIITENGFIRCKAGGK
ncbi:5-formyltetrahydrofolate cyclo-ligase [Filibacter tadaridae]|uniref:5-formyltetrahydrofolate cyclo-ligase n=1 Tax=Filibacter tadaridae TaxID=2483811 RepID=A0A3P5XLA0_9BACL|nr:5-formyltetrahydrofolate cyclo-ligase [Filibacter tadaridae]VDC32433.1 putative 5-formyltetrahydrofolate cyclo-ligase [Filibacter tadaridae]